LPVLIEFYDARYPFDKDKHDQKKLGQFIGRYYADTLLSDPEDLRGLNLHGGIKDWSLDADTFAKFRAWIGGQA
jgi:hypothetical protein